MSRRYEPHTVSAVTFQNFKDITLEGIDDFISDTLKDSKRREMTVEETAPYTTLKDRIQAATSFLEIMDILIETNFSDHESMFRDLVDALGG